jgi:hypothetical protein
MEHFVRFDRFPEDDKWLVKQTQTRTKTIGPRNAKFIETTIKSNNLEEFLSIFAPISSVMTVLFMLHGGQNPTDMMKMLGEAAQQQQRVGRIEEETDEEDSTKLTKSKMKAAANMPALYKFQETGNASPSVAQRNMIQKYITAVRPMVEQQINLPKEAMRLSNAGKGELSLRSNQKPGPLVQKTGKIPTKAKTLISDSASTVSSKSPRKLNVRRPSVETLPSTASTAPTTRKSTGLTMSSARSTVPSSVSVATSSKPRVVPAEKAPIKPWTIDGKPTTTKAAPAKPAYAFKPTSQTASKASPAGKAGEKKEPPTIKMDKATYDKLKSKNQDAAAAKKPAAAPLAPRSVNIDPAVLEKMKAASKPILKAAGSTPQKSTKSVQIDPAILAKMKEKQK